VRYTSRSFEIGKEDRLASGARKAQVLHRRQFPRDARREIAYTVVISSEEAAMAIKQINPYLNFNGTADKAVQLYQSALGAKVENIMRFGDAAGNMPVAPADKNRVMHAVLNLGAGVIMLSDTMPNQPVGADGNVHITLDFDDVEEMTRKFDALAAGGNVTMPLQNAFWGARFGMLTDAFGIRWMFNCEQRKG
jgi:PhnB protein